MYFTVTALPYHDFMFLSSAVINLIVKWKLFQTTHYSKSGGNKVISWTRDAHEGK